MPIPSLGLAAAIRTASPNAVPGDSDFSAWRKYLKPVKSYEPNPWGLYDMSGNVWQMVGNEYKLAGRQWIFRLTHPNRDQPNGVFRICSPIRPRPFGMSILDVSEVENNVIRVRAIDMLDGTPI